MYFIKERADRYLKDLKEIIVREQKPIQRFKYREGEIPGAHKKEYPDGDWEVFRTGGSWGGYDKTAWFRRELSIPAGRDSDQLALEFFLGQGHQAGVSGAESLLFIEGKPYQGLDVRHSYVFLPRDMAGGTIQLAIRAFSGLEEEKSVFKTARLVWIDKTVRDFYYRAKTILETVSIMEKGDRDYQFLLNLLNKAINMLDYRKPRSENFYSSIERANRYLKKTLAENNPGEKLQPLVRAVGHAHIDVAWLWRLKHTRQKCARTFSSVLKLMEEYPEFKFVQSSPQLYQYIKEDYPEIYERIKEKVKEGSWEVTGGMWVEADTNIPDGESLIRQFLFGTRFIREEFDRKCQLVWLPDVFGYSWALPQIIKKSGLKYLMTTKISWNQFNRPENDTFKWRGPDGSELLTHFITTPDINDTPFYTYNGMIDPDSVQGLWDNYRQKDINDKLLLAFGWGDGGGGPTRGMLEKKEKINELPSLPAVEFRQAEDYFEDLAADLKNNSRLPIWDGELYLEYHRGTYTSQAKTKKNNRKAEVVLHNLESVGSLNCGLLDNYKYPQEEINELWPILLRNQFHDILPGSSIKGVYEDSEREFSELFVQGKDLVNGALKDLFQATEGQGEKLLVFNQLSWTRSGYLIIPWQDKYRDKVFINEEGERLFAEKLPETNELLLWVTEIPSYGYRTFKLVDKNATNNKTDSCEKDTETGVKVIGNQIENRYYQIELNGEGKIVSLYDKEVEMELIPENSQANVLQVFEDRPMKYNAWDIDIYYQEKEYTVDRLINREIVEKGPERVVIKFEWEFLDSYITQYLAVYADQKTIDFKTEVDWQQEQLLLKTAFPVNIRSREATYEIQFGNIKRPTHNNTTRDLAKFEVPAQKWADLSQRDYGVSLLNDCKYGYDIKGNVIRLTLIKSGVEPDPEADQGHHEFSYRLYPHKGDWYQAKTTEKGYEYNYPLLAVTGKSEGGRLPVSCSLVEIEAESVILRTVKKSEDDESLIFRFYEYGNRRDRVKLRIAGEIKSVQECNMMEEELNQGESQEQIQYCGSEFKFKINPYEIKTYKVKYK